MTKEEFKIFKDKQLELYAKYENSTDPKSDEEMTREWYEFLNKFINQIEQKYKCNYCKDTGYIQIAPNVRGLKVCPYCSKSKISII